MRFLTAVVAAVFMGCSVAAFSATALMDYQTANTLYQGGQYADALGKYQSCVQSDPTLWQAYQGAAYCQYKLGKPADCLASCDKALALHPDNPPLKQFADALRKVVLAPPAAPTGPAPGTKATHPAASADGKWKEMGIEFGVDMANMSGGQGAKSKIGAVLGGYYSLGLGPKMAIEPNALIVMKGSSIDYTVDQALMGMDMSVNTKGSVSLIYLEVPVLFKYYFSPERKFHVLGGLGFGFMVTKSFKETVTETLTMPGFPTQIVTTDVPSSSFAPSSTDISMDLGAGAKLGKMTVDLRYEMGLTSVSGTSKNGTFMLLVGYPMR